METAEKFDGQFMPDWVRRTQEWCEMTDDSTIEAGEWADEWQGDIFAVLLRAVGDVPMGYVVRITRVYTVERVQVFIYGESMWDRMHDTDRYWDYEPVRRIEVPAAALWPLNHVANGGPHKCARDMTTPALEALDAAARTLASGHITPAEYVAMRAAALLK